MAQTVPAGLADWAAALAGAPAGRVWTTDSGAVLVACEDVVVKVHPPDASAGLAARLRLAADPALAGILVTPLDAAPVPVPDGLLPDGPARLASRWPLVDVLAPDVAEPPWTAAAATLAALHRTPLPAATPAHGGHARLRRALDRLAPLADEPRAAAVLRAGATVVRDLARGRATRTALVHGDWHLGQLARDDAGRWLLLDVDDLGTGDPAWDLGRPAGFWAAGLLPDDAWDGFLTAYRSAGGPAVPSDDDPWPRLDVPARAEVVVAAARAVRHAWDEEAEALVAACGRM